VNGIGWHKPKRLWNRLVAKSLGTVTGVETGAAAVALTFDDGPDPDSTVRLAEALEKHGARGTFFVVGRSARRYPELLERLAGGGHAIGNHSWGHRSFPTLSSRQRRKQIRLCEKAIRPYGSKIFRPPFGHQDLRSRFDLLLAGYKVVTWSFLAEDWLDLDAGRILAKIEAKIRPGSIILLHDALFAYLDRKYTDRSATVEAVEELLERRGRSYDFVTVPQLLAMGKPRMVDWRRLPDRKWMKKLNQAENRQPF